MQTKLVVTSAALGLAAVLGVAACSGGGSKKSNSASLGVAGRANDAAAAPAVSGTQAGGAAQSAVPAEAPKIVRTGSMALNLDHGGLSHAFDEVSGVATVNGGFVSDSAASSGDNPTAHLPLRIPSANFDSAVAAIDKLGKVTSKQVKGEDVSSHLVALGARIQSLQAEEAAYRTLVGQAKVVNDVLTVQNQLFSVRQQIEQLTAQQASLDNKVT